jgi:hypothetical protein
MPAAIPSGLASRLHQPQDERREDQLHRQFDFPGRDMNESCNIDSKHGKSMPWG